MNPNTLMKACGLVLVFIGAVLLVIGFVTGKVAIWAAAPGMTAVGVVLLALSGKRQT
ncbi:hypothetical protein OS187_01750 [Xanthomonadaceae bacterium JHOS43]|nr:hypothetical protein [Xanthomonadaceae bacterium JHOS43]